MAPKRCFGAPFDRPEDSTFWGTVLVPLSKRTLFFHRFSMVPQGHCFSSLFSLSVYFCTPPPFWYVLKRPSSKHLQCNFVPLNFLLSNLIPLICTNPFPINNDCSYRNQEALNRLPKS